MAFNFSDFVERLLVYFPERELIADPLKIGRVFIEDVFQTKDGRKLYGWWIEHPQEKASLLFFHGNAGNISHRLDKIKILHETGVSIFIFDYSGFGKSEGTPSEQNLYQDGLAAYDYLINQRKKDPKNILFYGESLGCAVALEVATQNPVAGIILESPFVSLKEMARAHYPFLAFLAGDKFNNIEKIGKIDVPKLFIHSKNDEIIPFSQGLKLYENSPDSKQHLWLDRGSHNDAFFLNAHDYQNTLANYLKLL